MPLVKHGKITNDALVHVADDAEIPGDGFAQIRIRRGSEQLPFDLMLTRDCSGHFGKSFR